VNEFYLTVILNFLARKNSERSIFRKMLTASFGIVFAIGNMEKVFPISVF